MIKPRARRALWIAPLTVLVIAVAGCVFLPGDPPGGAITVKNALEVTVRMTLATGGSERSLADEDRGDTLAPGELKFFRLGLAKPRASDAPNCTEGALVARSLDGLELARTGRKLCEGEFFYLKEWLSTPSP